MACPPLDDDDDDDDDDEDDDDDDELVLELAVSSLLFVDIGFEIVLSVRSARERLLVCKDSVRTASTVVVIRTQATTKKHLMVKVRLVIVPIVETAKAPQK